MVLQNVRNWAKSLVYLELMGHVAWSVAAVLVGSLLIIYCLVAGQMDRVTSLLGSMMAGLALLGFLAWMTIDARKHLRKIHRGHRREIKPGPDGNMADVANLPHLPPWMGTTN